MPINNFLSFFYSLKYTVPFAFFTGHHHHLMCFGSVHHHHLMCFGNQYCQYSKRGRLNYNILCCRCMNTFFQWCANISFSISSDTWNDNVLDVVIGTYVCANNWLLAHTVCANYWLLAHIICANNWLFAHTVCASNWLLAHTICEKKVMKFSNFWILNFLGAPVATV